MAEPFADYDITLAAWWAPRHARVAVRLLLALDSRLQALGTNVREPLLADIKRAWWREQLAALDGATPAAEPLLLTLQNNVTLRGCGIMLAQLVDPEQKHIALADVLAHVCGSPNIATRVVRVWHGLNAYDTVRHARSQTLASPAMRTLIALRICLIGR